jgi:hypothetical protein
LQKRWLSSPQALPPSAEELKAYLLTPLQDEDKVPISSHEIGRLVSGGYPNIGCSERDLEVLFRVTEEEKAYIAFDLMPAIHRLAPHKDGSDGSFIHFWDTNIRGVLEAILYTGLYSGRAIRADRGVDSSLYLLDFGIDTDLCLPDFGFLVRNTCIFRGEEKSNRSPRTHPRSELLSKLNWTYDPAPYILGQCVSLT